MNVSALLLSPVNMVGAIPFRPFEGAGATMVTFTDMVVGSGAGAVLVTGAMVLIESVAGCHVWRCLS